MSAIEDPALQATNTKWKWGGHVARLRDGRWTQKVTLWDPRIGKRSRRRPRRRWADLFSERAGSHLSRRARNRNDWKNLRRQKDGSGGTGDIRRDAVVRSEAKVEDVELKDDRRVRTDGSYNNFHRLDWPAQSPDLNPIEHLCDELDQRLRSREMRPTSIVKLSAMLQEKWRRIPVDILHKLVESMPDRVAAVIATRGDTTRF
ncbi:hypothetical protein ANN_25876 [Periplaneta americana]|uniref:Tc1-like transposase DDE domain-containing protein n=1 Tax=Periplaneta americana TaxID=6978 RepID=A0ABQ8S4M6_PERAM|nr:hypothetical protein ANN_25876 [Periplaneta americana]